MACSTLSGKGLQQELLYFEHAHKFVQVRAARGPL